MSPSYPEHAPQQQADAECHGSATDIHVAPALPPVHLADNLLGGGNMALIVAGTQTCRLRLSRQGRLILNTYLTT